MAIIRDNRGAQLASNLSKHLSDVAGTAGTPLDTDHIVRIVNQYLGQGEQLSSQVATVSAGVYKKLGSIDIITNRTQVVTSGIWTGDTGSLVIQNTFTSSAQVASTSGRYYLDVYQKATSSTDAEVQFSIAYGDFNGYGAPQLSQDDQTKQPTQATYYQYRNVLLQENDGYFTVKSGSSGTYNMTSFYAINVNRARYKERMDPGNISLRLSGSRGIVTLIDDSGDQNQQVTKAGRVYNLVSGSLNIGTATTASINTYTASNGQGWGLFYPDMGLLLLNPLALSASVSGNLAPATQSVAGVYWQQSGPQTGSHALLTAIASGGEFMARRVENVSTSHYFIRANNREYNFSNNPSFVTGSTGQFYQAVFERDPHVYVTTVGLYNDAHELLAVAKTSKPIDKSFDKEIAIKVKLDF